MPETVPRGHLDVPDLDPKIIDAMYPKHIYGDRSRKWFYIMRAFVQCKELMANSPEFQHCFSGPFLKANGRYAYAPIGASDQTEGICTDDIFRSIVLAGFHQDKCRNKGTKDKSRVYTPKVKASGKGKKGVNGDDGDDGGLPDYPDPLSKRTSSPNPSYGLRRR